MYAPASGSGGSYSNGIAETSLSGASDEENKSGRISPTYLAETDYAIDILPSGVLTTHHQLHHHHQSHNGISTYLIDDNIPNPHNGMSTYFIDDNRPNNVTNYYPTAILI